MFGLKHDIELLQNADIEDLYKDPPGERDMKMMWFVWVYLTGKGTKSEPDIQSFSVRHTPRGARLTVKAIVQGIPRVAYVTDVTPTSCVRTFARWVLEDRVKWFPDKYA